LRKSSTESKAIKLRSVEWKFKDMDEWRQEKEEVFALNIKGK